MGGQVRASGHPGTGHTVSDFATFLPAPAALVEFECADAASPVASAAGAVSLLFFATAHVAFAGGGGGFPPVAFVAAAILLLKIVLLMRTGNGG
jgi:hypothetical protein